MKLFNQGIAHFQLSALSTRDFGVHKTRQERFPLTATSRCMRCPTPPLQIRHTRPPSLPQHNCIISMAPAEPTSDASSAESLDLPEIIFSYGICQASVTEVYATTESNKGFHSGSGDDDGIVTRLWIAECSHVVCGKHLPGGGRLRRCVRLHPC